MKHVTSRAFAVLLTTAALSLGVVSCNDSSKGTLLTPDSTATTEKLRGPHGPGGMGALMMPPEILKQKLGLTDDQVTRIEAIRDSFRTQMDTKLEAAGDDRDARRQVFEQNRGTLEAQVKAVLTPDQQTKLEALKAERPTAADMAAHRDSMVAHMKQDLNLSDAQIAQIQELLSKNQPPMPGPDHEDMHGPEGIHRGMHEGPGAHLRDQLKSILTPQQLAKLDSLHEARAPMHGPGPR